MSKNTKAHTISADALYDMELSLKAKEVYRVFSKKVLEESAMKNTHLHYPIHWLLTPVPEEKKTKTQYEITQEVARAARDLEELSSGALNAE